MTNELYQLYRNSNGGMSEAQFNRVLDYIPKDDDYTVAEEVLLRADGRFGRTARGSVSIAAKIIGGLKDEVEKDSSGRPDHFWVKMEGLSVAGILSRKRDIARKV